MTAGTPRTIKRYANRKLYDTQDSRYVTLDQIAEMIRDGEDVKVVDNGSKEDLTSVTLAQILFEEEKRQRSFLPLSALRKVIQGGGDSLHEFVSQLQESAGRIFSREEKAEASRQAAQSAKDGAAAANDARGEGEGEGEGEAQREGDEAGSGEREDAEGSAAPIRALRELVDSVHQTVDEWQRRFDANVHSAWESVSLPAPLQKELGRLREHIGDLERMLSFRRGEAAPPTETRDNQDGETRSS